MNDEQADLVQFGLTRLQSKIYLALLRVGPSRSGQLSSYTGVVRPEVHRVLRELAVKGLVQRKPGSPSTYSPTSPERGLSLIIERYKEKLHELETKKTALVSMLGTYPESYTDFPSGGFGVIMGADNVVARATRMILGARQEYVAIMSKYALRRANEDNVTDAVLSARKRNVRVRIISEIDESNSSVANALSKYISLRQINDVLVYLDIFDGKEMLFGPAITDVEVTHSSRRDVDLWTDNSRFVAGMRALFEHVWETSTKYRRSS